MVSSKYTQASPVMHLVTPLSWVSLPMNTQPSLPAIEQDEDDHAIMCIANRVNVASVSKNFETVLWTVEIMI